MTTSSKSARPGATPDATTRRVSVPETRGVPATGRPATPPAAAAAGEAGSTCSVTWASSVGCTWTAKARSGWPA
jgi:hypothetical protein